MDWGFPSNIPEFRLLRLVLLLLVLVMAVRCEGCKVDKCTREYERAMDQKEIPSREASVEYCEIVRDYGACLKRTGRFCRGNLFYHSTMSTAERLYRDLNCPELLNVSSAGHTPPPSSSVAPLPRPSTTAPSRRHCSFEGKRRFRHCGLFGDPHLKTFNNEYQTCRVRGAWPLIDNPYLAVQVTNEPVVEGSPATVTTKVTIIIRGRKTNCTQEKTYEATAEAVLPATFIDGTQRSGPDDSVILTEYEPQHVEIHLRYIETTLIIRQAGTYLAFSVRMPEEIVDSEGSDGDSLQLCVRGCPINERLDHIAERGHKMPWDKAVERCRRSDSNEVTNNLTDHYLDWCVFDVMTTGDADYFTAAAHSAQADVLRLDPASLKNKTTMRSAHELSASAGAVSPSAVLVVLVLLVTALERTPRV